MRAPPSSDGFNGRGPDGRFRPGNRLGRGSPLARKAASFRAALFAAATKADVASIARALIRESRRGDVSAAKLVLGYLVGEPISHDLVAELEELRTLVTELQTWASERRYAS